MFKSLREYVASVGHLGWVVLIDVLLAVLGAFVQFTGKADVPAWAWIALYATLLVVPFLAFHQMRVQRDAAAERCKHLESQLESKRASEETRNRFGQIIQEARVLLRTKHDEHPSGTDGWIGNYEKVKQDLCEHIKVNFSEFDHARVQACIERCEREAFRRGVGKISVRLVALNNMLTQLDPIVAEICR